MINKYTLGILPPYGRVPLTVKIILLKREMFTPCNTILTFYFSKVLH